MSVLSGFTGAVGFQGSFGSRFPLEPRTRGSCAGQECEDGEMGMGLKSEGKAEVWVRHRGASGFHFQTEAGAGKG